MKVWLVSTGDPDQETVLGIFDSEEEANKRVSDFKENQEGWGIDCEWVGANEYELNKSYPYFPCGEAKSKIDAIIPDSSLRREIKEHL